MSKIDQLIVASGWKKACVGDILKIRNGFAFKSSDYVDDGIPIVRQSNLNEGFVGISNAKHVSKKFLKELPGFIIKEGDLLVGMSGSLGKISRYLEKEPALQNQRTGLLVLKQSIDPRFAKLVLKLVEPQIISEGKGIAVQNVSAKQIEDCIFPLPPVKIRHLLVDEVEKQYSRLDEAVASLKRIQSNLKRYKSAVLKFALEGKFTEQWRKDHPDVEPADQLLKRILAERRAKWEAEELAKMKVKGTNPKDDSWKKKYKEPAGPDTANLPELPEDWMWARLEAIAALKGGITVDKKRKDPTARFVPYLRVANVQRGYIDLTEMKEIEASQSVIEDLSLIPDDILFNEGGDRDKLGRGWIWEGQLAECIHQNHVFRARLHLGDISAKIISWWGNTFGKDYFLRVGKQTTNLASINISKLSEFPVPLPPVLEQLQIVAEVERRLSITEELETTIDINLKRAERLRQVILQNSFSEQLIPEKFNAELSDVLFENNKYDKDVLDEEVNVIKRGRVAKMKFDNYKRQLLDVIKENPDGITPEALLVQANYSIDEVDDFYEKLSMIRELIEQDKPVGESSHRLPGQTKVLIKPKRI